MWRQNFVLGDSGKEGTLSSQNDLTLVKSNSLHRCNNNIIIIIGKISPKLAYIEAGFKYLPWVGFYVNKIKVPHFINFYIKFIWQASFICWTV